MYVYINIYTYIYIYIYVNGNVSMFDCQRVDRRLLAFTLRRLETRRLLRFEDTALWQAAGLGCGCGCGCGCSVFTVLSHFSLFLHAYHPECGDTLAISWCQPAKFSPLNWFNPNVMWFLWFLDRQKAKTRQGIGTTGVETPIESSNFCAKLVNRTGLTMVYGCLSVVPQKGVAEVSEEET